MLVVISDLHFQDVENDCVILKDKSKFDPKVDRNVGAEAFDLFAEDIKVAAEQNICKTNSELIILLAGDIFDLTRSQKWFDGASRPYHAGTNTTTTPSWEDTAGIILQAIIKNNKPAIDALVDLVECCNIKGWNARIDFIPGNHDRIINLSQSLRQMVINALKIGIFNQSQNQMVLRNSNAPFENYFPSCKPGEAHPGKYGVLVRHGHEYDSFNFSGKTDSKDGWVSRYIPSSEYAMPSFGDYVTVELVTGLAHKARELIKEGDPTASEMKTYKKIYRKLLEFDDVRPQTSVFDFIDFSFNGQDVSDVLNPIIDGALEKFFAIDEVNGYIAKKGRWIQLKSWLNNHVNKGAKRAKALLDAVKDETPAWKSAAKEEILYDNSSPIRYIVAGHTHHPSFEPLKANLTAPLDESSEKEDDYFFFDTGTWRKVIKQCNVEDKSFASAKSLTYLIFYNGSSGKCVGKTS